MRGTPPASSARRALDEKEGGTACLQAVFSSGACREVRFSKPRMGRLDSQRVQDAPMGLCVMEARFPRASARGYPRRPAGPEKRPGSGFSRAATCVTHPPSENQRLCRDERRCTQITGFHNNSHLRSSAFIPAHYLREKHRRCHSRRTTTSSRPASALTVCDWPGLSGRLMSSSTLPLGRSSKRNPPCASVVVISI